MLVYVLILWSLLGFYFCFIMLFIVLNTLTQGELVKSAQLLCLGCVKDMRKCRKNWKYELRMSKNVYLQRTYYEGSDTDDLLSWDSSSSNEDEENLKYIPHEEELKDNPRRKHISVANRFGDYYSNRGGPTFPLGIPIPSNKDGEQKHRREVIKVDAVIESMVIKDIMKARLGRNERDYTRKRGYVKPDDYIFHVRITKEQMKKYSLPLVFEVPACDFIDQWKSIPDSALCTITITQIDRKDSVLPNCKIPFVRQTHFDYKGQKNLKRDIVFEFCNVTVTLRKSQKTGEILTVDSEAKSMVDPME